ncbi:MAG: SDR family oxidoreductase [Planctomycetota bacterium]
MHIGGFSGVDFVKETFVNRNIVVVGGGTGIGAGIVKNLSKQGAKLVIGGRRIEKLQEVAESESNVTPIAVDVADRQSIESFFDKAKEYLGEIHVMINCAGMNIPNRTMATMKPEDWDRVMQVNATGAYLCMYQVLEEMRARKDGLIINVSSIAGKRAITLGGVVYCASKFAMTALGTAAANEVADEGVRITNVYPGEVNTPILDNRPTPVSDEHKASILQPEDIAEMIATIVSLPPRAHVPEIVIKPTRQQWV